MSDAVRRLVDERGAELIGRFEQLEHVRAAGEGASTRALEVGLLESELRFLKRVLEALLVEVEQGRGRRGVH